MQQQIFFGPDPWGPGEGSKDQISHFSNKLVRVQRSGIDTVKYHT